MFGSWVQNEIWIIDLSSALDGKLMSSSKLFLFSNEAHLNSAVLYYLYEINNDIHMYQFTFESLYFCLHMWLWFRI